ncbi:uncharacterized protein AMSG_12068 [Thecamonas trahens ATCC 50062]|uniref:Elongation of fatty acids protein n=1 Tax=Thecamonas trahens ATCC 50062 TaxID=461836 RepID=A0A0L0DG59_THETB|nr:hypothetical protein AMSG_12068 [Thecamonas trahens ATCC 50062]KNC51327.1 hypothetical protein AMSG_12068 [Thecamonas trahens ATCC 50062]|eukprot:XP_013756307.1 hypothetical protein AMSG_12068 [Thecamonas trahens ATCC 50062]
MALSAVTSFYASLPPLEPPASWGWELDSRTSKWFLMDPWQYLTVVLAYIVMVVVGPWLMASRQAFDLYYIRLVYNAVMVVLSGYMCYELTYNTFWAIPVEHNPAGDRIASALWLYAMSKIPEYLDTLFMILRKKNKQISFLHVYHHASIGLVWLINGLYFPGGDAWFAAAFNAFIHVLMYSYYFLRTINVPCPWKRFLTVFQLIQFVSFVAQGAYGLIIGNPYYGKEILAFNMCYAFTLLALFYNFYRTTYNRKPKSKAQRRTAAAARATREPVDRPVVARCTAWTVTVPDAASASLLSRAGYGHAMFDRAPGGATLPLARGINRRRASGHHSRPPSAIPLAPASVPTPDLPPPSLKRARSDAGACHFGHGAGIDPDLVSLLPVRRSKRRRKLKDGDGDGGSGDSGAGVGTPPPAVAAARSAATSPAGSAEPSPSTAMLGAVAEPRRLPAATVINPLHLMPVETFFLVQALGVMQVRDASCGAALTPAALWRRFSARDRDFARKYAAYHFFRSRGWTPRDGTQFGCHFVLYQLVPAAHHAQFCVRILAGDSDPWSANWVSIKALQRTASLAHKQILLVQVTFRHGASLDAMSCLRGATVQTVRLGRCRRAEDLERFMPQLPPPAPKINGSKGKAKAKGKGSKSSTASSTNKHRVG